MEERNASTSTTVSLVYYLSGLHEQKHQFKVLAASRGEREKLVMVFRPSFPYSETS